nr:MAG TPA: hypothetical protein [Crassvirales sp.]
MSFLNSYNKALISTYPAPQSVVASKVLYIGCF